MKNEEKSSPMKEDKIQKLLFEGITAHDYIAFVIFALLFIGASLTAIFTLDIVAFSLALIFAPLAFIFWISSKGSKELMK